MSLPSYFLFRFLRQDVATLLSVPTDSLKRVTRERKYAIEALGKCLEEARSSGAGGQGVLVDKLKALRERFRDTHVQEQVNIRKLEARVGYVKEHVVEKERAQRAQRERHGSVPGVSGNGDYAGGGEHAINERVRSIESSRKRATDGSPSHTARASTPPVPSAQSIQSIPPVSSIPYLDVLIQEYLARQGYVTSLRTLQQSHPEFLPLLIDMEQYEELNRLVASVEERHSCEEALAWCGKHAAKLKKLKSALVFQLHVQEFVRMLDGSEGGGEGRAALSNEAKRRAMAYARKHLSGYAETYPEEFQRAAGILVLRDILPESTSCAELFAVRRWHDISSLLRRDYFSIHGLSLTSPLETHLACGIAALQVSSKEEGATRGGVKGRAREREAAGDGRVGHESQQRAAGSGDHMDVDVAVAGEGPRTAMDHNEDNNNNDHKVSSRMHGRVNQQNDDPLRHPAIQKLAANVPFSKRTVSKLVCPVTGIVMEGNNQPVVLPNGYVYGSLAVYGGLLDWNGDAQNGGAQNGNAQNGHGGQDGIRSSGTGPGEAASMGGRQSLGLGTTPTPGASRGTDPRGLSTKQIHCPCTDDIFSMDEVRKLFIV